jgi:cysteine sulfinate desulfinase/cysteine desulfurase-like protein
VKELVQKVKALPHVITCSTEHPAILVYLQALQKAGKISLSIMGVDSCGFINPDEVNKALTLETALVTVMHSNNEVGTMQPIRLLSEVIRTFNTKHGGRVLLHTGIYSICMCQVLQQY